MYPQAKAKPPNAKIFWLVWLTLIALAGGSFFLLWRFVPVTLKATVFRQTASGWESLPPLGTAGYDLRISTTGVAWLHTPKGLSRLEGTSWHRFNASDFGTAFGYFPGEFTLDGETREISARSSRRTPNSNSNSSS